MARNSQEAIAIVLNIGLSASTEIDLHGQSFFSKTLSCVSMVLQRKVFSCSKDEVSIILLGSENTDNNLNYKNICLAYPLGAPNWNMIEYIEKGIQPSLVDADWFEALILGLDVLKKRTTGKKFWTKKIVIFSNFSSKLNDEHDNELEIIIQSFRDMDINLIVIGPDVITMNMVRIELESEDIFDRCISPSLNDDINQKKNGIILLSNLVTQIDGIICSFEDALPQLTLYQKKSVRPNPWNVIMDIGSTIKIPVSGYLMISDGSSLPSWKKALIADQEARIVTEVSFFNDDENQSVVEKDNVIKAYHFGPTMIPFTGVDKEAMSYKSGERALNILGFTSSSNIPRHLLLGDGAYYFTAQKDNQPAVKALSAFSHTLEKKNMVAIARRVYNSGSAPIIGVLFPKVMDKTKGLIFIRLPFSEDLRDFLFGSLKSDLEGITDDQIKSIDTLIDRMDLMVIGHNGEELFESKNLIDPHYQHMLASLSHRSLYPDSQLPPPKSTILELITSPFDVEESVIDKLDQLKKEFNLQEIARQTKKKPSIEIFKQASDGKFYPFEEYNEANHTSLKGIFSKDVTEVGTITPEQDFLTLLKKGEPFYTVCGQMQDAIMKLVMHSFGSDGFIKAVAALKLLREKCKELFPDLFNQWLLNLKENLIERGKVGFWNMILKDNIGLISVVENPGSTVTAKDAEIFFINSVVKATDSEEDLMDAENLFDEM